MIEINLLPKGYRKKQVSLSFGKTGIYAVAAVVGVVLMLGVITIYQMQQLSSLDNNMEKARQRAAMLKKDIELVDGLTDVKTKIAARMAAVERLDSHRSAWVRILEDISSNVPEFVWLGRFTEKAPPTDSTDAKSNKKGQQNSPQNAQAPQPKPKPANKGPVIHPVEIEGYAFTLNALASLMINTMRSDYFDNVELVSTNEMTLGDERAYNFVLSCNLHYLSDEQLQDLIAQTEESTQTSAGDTRHKSLN